MIPDNSLRMPVHLSPVPNEEEEDNSSRSNITHQGRLNKGALDIDQYIVINLGLVACVAVVGILLAEIVNLIKEIVQDKIWQPNLVTLEKQITEKFSIEFISKIKNINNMNHLRLFKRLAISKQEEVEVIAYLENNFSITSEELREILMGAHVRLDDDGDAYDEWSAKMMSKKQRSSSHPSDDAQYAIQGALINELLFSRLEVNGKSYTWFQLENHPVTLGHLIRHMKDYFVYKLTKRNQGPHGSSLATHHNPIILTRKNT